jgi:hypothetical protein
VPRISGQPKHLAVKLVVDLVTGDPVDVAAQALGFGAAGVDERAGHEGSVRVIWYLCGP